MKTLVRPELPTASVGSSQAPTAAVDNSAPLATRPQSTYKSGKAVQISGATLSPNSGRGFSFPTGSSQWISASRPSGTGPWSTTARPAAQRAEALKERFTFKQEMYDEARKALFPQNARLAA